MSRERNCTTRAIALLSGGLDSLIAAHLATCDHDLRLAITCDYGQRAAVAETKAAAIQAARLNIPHHIVNLPWLGDLSAAAITAPEAEMPHPQVSQLDQPTVTADSARQVWVPNRNAVFLMVAAAYAEVLECDAIVAGFNAEEAAAFPDNSPEFVAAASDLLQYSTANQPTIVCPTLQMTKTQMVQLASERGIALDILYSCYEAGPRHCWRCESCRRLQRALTEAGQWETLRHRL